MKEIREQPRGTDETLGEAFAELRRICEEEAYELEIPPREAPPAVEPNWDTDRAQEEISKDP
jgi:hypothetical protein